MYAIFKREFLGFLSSLTAFIIIGVFLLVTGMLLWFFPDTSIPDYGYAELSSFFSLAPFLFMFLMPAITMRIFAEEKKEGTYILLVTRPVTLWQILLAKYLACIALLLMALLPTGFYYYSVHNLGLPAGNIDSGAVTGSYTGLFLLGSAFTAVGVFTSSITRNQVVAFALAVFCCFVFYSGLESAAGVPALRSVENGLESLGINAHYQSISRGVLDTRDLVYFICFNGVFLGLTRLILGQTTVKKYRGILIFAVAIACFGVISTYFYTRFDFTTDKRFTLTQKTTSVLRDTKKELFITVFLDGDLPAPFRRLKSAVSDLLADYNATSGANIRVIFEDPLENADAATRDTILYNLGQMGIQPTAVKIKTDDGFSEKLIFPMAIIEGGSKPLPLKLLQNQDAAGDYESHINNSIRNLEYIFTSAIRQVQSGVTPRIGFSESNGELSDARLQDAINSLSDRYEVGRVDLRLISREGLDKLKLLVIAKPQQAFTEEEKYKLNYFLLRGGRLVWSIDQVKAELDSLGNRPSQMATNNNLNIDDLLFEYGTRINYNLIADANCADIPLSMGNSSNSQMELAPWPYHPLLLPDTSNNLVKSLDAVRGEFVSTVDTIGKKGLKKTILLYSSPYNFIHATPRLFSLQLISEKPDPKLFTGVMQPAAVLVEGNFSSAFLNRPVPSGITESYEVPAVPVASKMIVIGDGDIFKNQVSGRDGSAFPLGYDRYTERNFGNKAFLLNIADYMTSEDNLIALRNKDITVRLLDKTRLRSEKVFWQFFNIAGPLLLLVLFAIFQHYFRKYKYAK